MRLCLHLFAFALSFAVSVAVAGCGTSTSGHYLPPINYGDGGGPDLVFTFASDDGGGPDLAVPGVACSDQNPCPMGKRCVDGTCLPDNGSCVNDNTCENDTYCDCAGGGGGDAGACLNGACVPYGIAPRGPFDPGCQNQSFPSTDLKAPIVKCSWIEDNVIVTPLVIDLDLDGKPEIVFVTYPAGALVAIHGHDCSPVWNMPVGLNNFAQLAAADLDGDKFPEIIAVTADHRLVVFDHNGAKLAEAQTSYGGGGLGSDCSGPLVVDVDGMDPPEIAIGGQVARYVKGQGIQILFTNPATEAQWGTVSVAADLDGDGVPELITGREVYDGKTGANKTPQGWSALHGPGAYPAVADFNHDHKPDVVIVQSQSGQETVSIWDWANQKFIFGPLPVQGGWGGPPTVADFDGDGTPDFGSAGPNNYFVFSMKCWPNGGAGCVGPGILWKKTTHDISSGGTASSVFDFNGDGKAEVVYRDECFFRVINGPDGKTDFAIQITSGTCLENPVIADVDGDGHADVVVPSDNVQGDFCNGASDPDTHQVWNMQTRGIFVLSDPMNRWMPSRGIWNEHSYHITNVNDNGSIPLHEKPNWSSWNNYRANVQGMVNGMSSPASDFTAGLSSSVDNGGNDCKQSERLWANLCNRGTSTVKAGVPGTFYTADPRMPGAKAICSTMTVGPLGPGVCEAVFCDWMNPPQGPQDLWFRANDDGTKASVQSECDGDNDLLFLPQVKCFING